MWQLTIRDTDDALEQRLRRLAQHEGVSLNKAALYLLRKGVGLVGSNRPMDVVGDSLDHLIGSWSDADEEELLRAIEPFEQIDPTLWT